MTAAVFYFLASTVPMVFLWPWKTNKTTSSL